MEQQPFYIGQKVVCIGFDNTIPAQFKVPLVFSKGDIGTIIYTEYSDEIKGRKAWYVVLDLQPEALVLARYFAPLNPPRVSAIPELLKDSVEERLDAHPVKILTDG